MRRILEQTIAVVLPYLARLDPDQRVAYEVVDEEIGEGGVEKRIHRPTSGHSTLATASASYKEQWTTGA